MALAALDALGNALPCGGAALEATLRVFTGAAAEGGARLAEERPAEVADRGDGTYEVACGLKQACDFEVGSPVMQSFNQAAVGLLATLTRHDLQSA